MSLASLRLLQLCSANLPTGAYAFSQGLETATEESWLTTQQQSYEFLKLQIEYSLGRCDLAVLRNTLSALEHSDIAQAFSHNDLLLALRETKELRLTDTATGAALIRVLNGLNGISLDDYFADKKIADTEISFVLAFSFACHQWGINADDACLGYAWSWLENQVAAATKLVPLGQTQSQQLLEQLQADVMAAVEQSGLIDDDDIGESLPMLAIASCWHEHQYSRLFRS